MPFTLLVLADLFSDKVNLEITFPEKPTLEVLRSRVQNQITAEMQALQPPDVAAIDQFVVSRVQVYDDLGSRWVDLSSPHQLHEFDQLHCFQPLNPCQKNVSVEHLPCPRPPTVPVPRMAPPSCQSPFFACLVEWRDVSAPAFADEELARWLHKYAGYEEDLYLALAHTYGARPKWPDSCPSKQKRLAPDNLQAPKRTQEPLLLDDTPAAATSASAATSPQQPPAPNGHCNSPPSRCPPAKPTWTYRVEPAPEHSGAPTQRQARSEAARAASLEELYRVGGGGGGGGGRRGGSGVQWVNKELRDAMGVRQRCSWSS